MKPSSRTRPTTRQTGYALILMVLGLMGIGGVVIAGFTQQAKEDLEVQRYQHNKRVLEQAKQGLLMFAYNYPQTNVNGIGPGRLPCPDVDNDGSVDGAGTCAQVGRFPWSDNRLGTQELRDASGERLWYAVSDAFDNIAGGGVINYDTTGTITLVDQSGGIIYDGAVAGIAAVIIAPGTILKRDDDDDGTYEYTQLRNTDPQKVDPRNYLDTFNSFDNSVFTNGGNADVDGFILGPVFDNTQSTIVVNDQLVIVSAAEVIAMAEKATLQAYRDAFEIYLNRPGFGRYPWLDPYDSSDGLATYDAEINPAPPAPVIGRVPSTFGNYFVAAPLSNTQPIVSEMTIKLNIDGHPVEVRAPASAVLKSNFTTTGDLVAPFNNFATFTGWVWDGSPTQIPTFPVNGWEACPYVTGTEEDCNQDAGGNFIGGSSSPMWLTVRKVSFTFSGSSPFVFPFADRVDPDPVTGVTYVPPSATSHAYVEAEYDGPGYISASVVWEEDQEFQDGHDIFPALNVGSLTYDGGDSVTVGIRYYPELPRWALTNDWHNRVQVAYSSALQPGGDGNCTAGVDDCLTLQNIGGISNDKTGLIILSGADINGDVDLGLVDGLDDAAQAPNGDSLGIGFNLLLSDDLADIFEGENNTPDLTFDYRPVNSNDTVLLLE